jgi:hypothetical protein
VHALLEDRVVEAGEEVVGRRFNHGGNEVFNRRFRRWAQMAEGLRFYRRSSAKSAVS